MASCQGEQLRARRHMASSLWPVGRFLRRSSRPCVKSQRSGRCSDSLAAPGQDHGVVQQSSPKRSCVRRDIRSAPIVAAHRHQMPATARHAVSFTKTGALRPHATPFPLLGCGLRGRTAPAGPGRSLQTVVGCRQVGRHLAQARLGLHRTMDRLILPHHRGRTWHC